MRANQSRLRAPREFRTGTAEPEKLPSQRVILYAQEFEAYRQELLEAGAWVIEEYPFINAVCIGIPPMGMGKIAHMNGVCHLTPDEPASTQMHIASRTIHADQLHSQGITGKGIRVAVVDTGIYPHSDFVKPANRIFRFVDLVKGNHKKPYDDNGHGTFTAGVLAGNGWLSGGKYIGIAPEASIIALKAMNAEGVGNTSDVLRAMQWVADHHRRLDIRVVSLSLGIERSYNVAEDVLVMGVEKLWAMGMVVVVASGNAGPSPGSITIPGISHRIITVGASDDKRTIDIADDSIADFSSRGPVEHGYRKPDLVAPGVDVISVQSDTLHPLRQSSNSAAPVMEGYTHMSGTSVATPIVAGAAALLLQQHPYWKPDQVKNALKEKAIPLIGDPNTEGNGLVQL